MSSWLNQSFIAMLCLIPAWLAISFFDKNFGIKPEVFLVWYFLGVGITTTFFGGVVAKKFFPPWEIIVGILVIGLVIGGIANIFLFRAVASAPNPGLPVAIANVASVGVYLAAAGLHRVAPKYFGVKEIDWWVLLGVALTIVGASIIVIRR